MDGNLSTTTYYYITEQMLDLLLAGVNILIEAQYHADIFPPRVLALGLHKFMLEDACFVPQPWGRRMSERRGVIYSELAWSALAVSE